MRKTMKAQLITSVVSIWQLKTRRESRHEVTIEYQGVYVLMCNLGLIAREIMYYKMLDQR